MKTKLVMVIILFLLLAACSSENKESDKNDLNEDAETVVKQLFKDVEEENIPNLKEHFGHMEGGSYSEEQIKEELAIGYQYYHLDEIEVNSIKKAELIEAEQEEIENSENELSVVLVTYTGEANIPDLVFWMEQIEGTFYPVDMGPFQDVYYAFNNKRKYRGQLEENERRQEAYKNYGIYSDNIGKHMKNAEKFLNDVVGNLTYYFSNILPQNPGAETEITLYDLRNASEGWKPLEDPDNDNGEYDLYSSLVRVYFVGDQYEYSVTLIGSDYQIVNKTKDELNREAVEKR